MWSPDVLLLCAVSSVLNHCEVHRIAAVVYQCYSDVIGPDSVTMETYKPALTKLGKSIQVSCFSFCIWEVCRKVRGQKEQQDRRSAHLTDVSLFKAQNTLGLDCTPWKMLDFQQKPRYFLIYFLILFIAFLPVHWITLFQVSFNVKEEAEFLVNDSSMWSSDEFISVFSVIKINIYFALSWTMSEGFKAQKHNAQFVHQRRDERWATRRPPRHSSPDLTEVCWSFQRTWTSLTMATGNWTRAR